MDLTTYYPTVVGYEPNLDTENVDTRPVISVRFSVDLDPSEINTNEGLARFVILTDESSETSVPVEYVSYSSCILSFQPSGYLTEGGSYQVTILRGIPSFDGRTMQFNRTFTFTVAANDVPQVTLLSPGDKTSHSTVPAFRWSPIVYDTEYTVQYRIQVDTTTGFTTFDESGWTTLTTETSGLPDTALTQSLSYFWRVRAEIVSGDVTLEGDWSEVRTFYLGTALQPSPSVQQTYVESVPFQVDTASIEYGLSNQTSFPSLVFTFTAAVDSSTAGAVSFVRASVDGYPSSATTAVGGTVAVDGTTISIVPSESIIANTRYTVTFTTALTDTSGNALPQTYKMMFTSYYSPLYVGADVLRATFGGLLIDYPDDLLNFYAFRTSLDLNRFTLSERNPSEDSVRTAVVIIEYAMERWVEHKTAERMITMKYYELLETADSMRRLGDFTEQRGARVLGELEAARKREAAEAQYWFLQFSARGVKPRSVVKSGNWDPYNRHLDKSFRSFIRDIR